MKKNWFTFSSSTQHVEMRPVLGGLFYRCVHRRDTTGARPALTVRWFLRWMDAYLWFAERSVTARLGNVPS